MRRRQFLKGALGTAASVLVPGGDGVELTSAAHPLIHTGNPAPALLPMVGDADTGIYAAGGDQLNLVAGGQRLAGALAKSLMETREMVAVNAYHRGIDLETPFDLSSASLEEIEVDIQEE